MFTIIIIIIIMIIYYNHFNFLFFWIQIISVAHVIINIML